MFASYYPKPYNRVMGIWAHEQARVLQRNGHRVTVISLTAWLPKVKLLPEKAYSIASIPGYENYEGVNIYHVKIPVWPQIKLADALYKTYPMMKAYLAYAFARGTIKEIIARDRIEIIHAHGPGYDGVVGYYASQATGIPFCVTENSAWDPVYARQHNRHMDRVYRLIFKEASQIVPVSQLIKDRINEFPGIQQEKLSVVHPGVDLVKAGRIRAKKPDRYQERDVILSVGALEERKGHIYLIEAVNLLRHEYPRMQCIIVGADSTEEQKLRARIAELQLEELVEITGQLPHDQTLGYLSWCDVFVLPSWLEAFGVVFAEAMAYGKPVIGVHGEGISDVIVHGENGLLVPPRDAQALAANLRHLLDHMPYRKRLGDAGKRTVEEVLSWDYNARRMISVYRKAVK